jgi:hypothetical protein
MMKWQTNQRLIQEVLEALNTAHEEYTLLSANEYAAVVDNWWQQSFPFASWGRVLWEEVPNSVCIAWSEKWNDLVHSFQTLCSEQKLLNPTVVIVWSNALKPALSTSLDAVRRHAAVIFEADFDTWIICQTDRWCIEVYHEGELCFGRAINK